MPNQILDLMRIYMKNIFWKIFLALLLLVHPTPTQTPAPTPGNFPKFAVFSDIHSDTANLAKALKITKDDEMEFIIITGDLTTIGKKEELLKIKKNLDESTIKYYVIPGNHDLWFGRQIHQNVFREVFGQEYQSFNIDNTKFILLNNGDDYQGIGEQQGLWLDDQLRDCPKIICLVFMHEPLNHPYSTHLMGESELKVASQAAELATSLVKNQVKEVFAGHLHSANEYQINDLKTTIVGSLSTNRNPQEPRFLEVLGTDQQKEIVISD